MCERNRAFPDPRFSSVECVRRRRKEQEAVAAFAPEARFPRCELGSRIGDFYSPPGRYRRSSGHSARSEPRPDDLARLGVIWIERDTLGALSNQICGGARAKAVPPSVDKGVGAKNPVPAENRAGQAARFQIRRRADRKRAIPAGASHGR